MRNLNIRIMERQFDELHSYYDKRDGSKNGYYLNLMNMGLGELQRNMRFSAGTATEQDFYAFPIEKENVPDPKLIEKQEKALWEEFLLHKEFMAWRLKNGK